MSFCKFLLGKHLWMVLLSNSVVLQIECLCPPPLNSYVKALIPNVMVFGDCTFGRQLGHEDEVLMMGLMALKEETQRDDLSLRHVRRQ